MHLRAVILSLVAVLLACGGSADLVPMKGDVGPDDVGRDHSAPAPELPVPNAAPVVSLFVASKSQGTAPVTSTLSWEVNDANGDALSCSLDVDGAQVATVPDCTTQTSFTHTFAHGEHVAKLTVRDVHGAVSTAELTVRGVAPVGDVRVVRAEYGQTVLSPTLKLVPGKAAMIRVFVLADTANLATTAALHRVVDGAVVETLPLVGPTTVPTVEDAALAATWVAKLPAAWIAPGLRLRVTVDEEDLLPESDETNNSLELSPAVGKANALAITAVPVVYKEKTATIYDFRDSLIEIFPVAQVTKQDRAPYTFTGDFTNVYGGWADLLGDIASLRNVDGSQEHYFGLIDTSEGGGIAGLGFLGQPAAVGLSYYGHIVPHELGHNLSLPHAPCGPVSGTASGYPYAGGEIGTYGVIAENLQLVPKTYKDLMSYCQPTWISDFFYDRAQTFLEAQTFQTGAAVAAPMILVHGFITRDGQVTVKPVHRLQSWPTRNEGDGLLVVETAEGAVQTRFVLSEEAEEGSRHFSVLLKDPGAIRTLELSVRGVVVAKRSAVPPPATVAPELTASLRLAEKEGMVQLQWDAKVHPFATLAFVGGSGRTTFAFKLRGGTAEVQTGRLPPGGAFEVSLSDGIHAVTVNRARP